MILTVFKTSTTGPIGSIIYDADKKEILSTKSEFAIHLSFLATMTFGLVFPNTTLEINSSQEIVGPFPVKPDMSERIFYAFPFRAYDESYIDNRMDNISSCLLIILMKKKGNLRFNDGAQQILLDSFKDLLDIKTIDINFLRNLAAVLKPLEAEDVIEFENYQELSLTRTRNILIIATSDLNELMIRYIKRTIYLSAVTTFSLTENRANICTKNKINLFVYWSKNDKNWYEKLKEFHGVLFIGLGELESDTRSDFLNDLRQILKNTSNVVPIGFYFLNKKKDIVQDLLDESRKIFSSNDLEGRSFELKGVESKVHIDTVIFRGILWLISLI
ncbi:MAG: hypothetical protein ACXADA_18480 [Candidatus Hodarchaeales archaeon]|jgi:hypothetical protein